MRTVSNTLHLRTDDARAAVRAYTTLLRRKGWRPRARGGIPHYCETRDDPAFRRVLISRPMNGWITIIDQQFDAQQLDVLDGITRETSAALRCAALSMVLDSEALYLFAWERGNRLDRWCSWPGWYAAQPATPTLKARWRGHPEKLIGLCRPGVSERQLSDILRDWSDVPDPDIVFPESLLCRLQDAFAIEGGPRTYASLHEAPAALYLAVPGARAPIRISREPAEDTYWSAFTELELINL